MRSGKNEPTDIDEPSQQVKHSTAPSSEWLTELTISGSWLSRTSVSIACMIPRTVHLPQLCCSGRFLEEVSI